MMSSLCKHPVQTAPVKIGPVKRTGQTCKPAKREKGQKRRETRGEREREREREGGRGETEIARERLFLLSLLATEFLSRERERGEERDR